MKHHFCLLRKLSFLRCCFAVCLAVSWLISPQIASSADNIHEIVYHLSISPNDHPDTVHIRMTIPVDAKEKLVQIQMPVWSPGDYHVQNHAQYVMGLTAEGTDIMEAKDGPVASALVPIKVDHINSNTWRMKTEHCLTLNISYYLKTTPPGIFSENVKISKNEAFLNGPAAFMYVVGHKNSSIRLETIIDTNWQIESPMKSIQEDPSSGHNNEYSAPDYDTFADAPLLVIKKNSVKSWNFVSGGASYRAVFYGNDTPIYGDAHYQDALKKIVHAENKMMGGPPSPNYMFFFDVNGTGGGLEHLNSTRIALPVNISVKSFSTFAAHEFFHQWNVKRIRPLSLGPFDYINPPRTHNLWFAEGVTEYYAWMSTFRAGLISRQELMRHFANAIVSLQNNAASSRITADELAGKSGRVVTVKDLAVSLTIKKGS